MIKRKKVIYMNFIYDSRVIDRKMEGVRLCDGFIKIIVGWYDIFRDAYNLLQRCISFQDIKKMRFLEKGLFICCKDIY